MHVFLILANSIAVCQNDQVSRRCCSACCVSRANVVNDVSKDFFQSIKCTSNATTVFATQCNVLPAVGINNTERNSRQAANSCEMGSDWLLLLIPNQEMELSLLV